MCIRDSRNVDHRGSTKNVRRTFCKDCQTYIDVIAQDLAKEQDEEERLRIQHMTLEETALMERVTDHSTITKEPVIKATELMMAQARHLEEGSYSMTTIGNMFIDCCDRCASFVPTAMMYCNTQRKVQKDRIWDKQCEWTQAEIDEWNNTQYGYTKAELEQFQNAWKHTWITKYLEKNGPKIIAELKRKGAIKDDKQANAHTTPMHKELQCFTLRVVDPLEDEHVWCIVDDACNSCCMGLSLIHI